MNERLFILIVIIGIFLLIIGVEYYQHVKLKQRVKNQWGKIPHQPRFDKEESLKSAWQQERSFKEWDSEIDDITWYDLDMFQVFELINATYSSVGSEALYQQLRNYHWQQDTEIEKLIAYYQEFPHEREKIQYAFAQLGKQDHNFSKHYLSNQEKKALGSLPVFILLGVLPFIGLFLFFIGQSSGLVLTIGSLVFNTIFYQIKKAQLDVELNSMRYLIQTIATGKKIAKISQPLHDDLHATLKNLKSILYFGISFRSKGNSETEVLFDYLNTMFMLPFISYSFVIHRIRHYQKDAIRLWEILGKLEVAAAVLNFRSFMPVTCQPTFKNGQVTAENIYHPLLEKAVMNPVDWQQTTLVTGSNASGKSTYVKSIAISCILAQTIQTAIAEKFVMQPGHVLTSMAVEDNISEGDSYFVAEIKSVKRLLDKVATKEHCYCFIDEILKGTNTVERIAASSSIVAWLSQTNSLSMVATHDIELTEMLKTTCENWHFSEQIDEDEGISFDYRVKKGAAKTRNAIALLSVLGYPDTIVTNAKHAAQHFDEQRTWLDLN